MGSQKESCHLQNKRPLPPATAGFEHVNRYWDRTMNLPAAKILPGECYVSGHGEIIATVLGSCIAACIRDKEIGVGGMNHFMLPLQNENSQINRANLVNSELCYGNWAMEYLINTIIKMGGRRDRLEVKVFGGGKVLSGMTNIDIGRRNVEFVLDFLDRDRLKVVAKDLGSDHPRKVLYFPDTGAVKLKRLRIVENDTVQRREKAYYDQMKQKTQTGDIELF